MPITNRKCSWTDDERIRDASGWLLELNLDLLPDDVIDAGVARRRYARPICDLGFAAKIRPEQTGIKGHQNSDTCFYYPEVRGIAQRSVRL